MIAHFLTIVMLFTMRTETTKTPILSMLPKFTTGNLYAPQAGLVELLANFHPARNSLRRLLLSK